MYASVLGGVRLSDPGADLAVCIAVASALLDRPLPIDLVVCGEIGLGGELRQVAQMPRRLAEAARLGFRRAIVPMSAPNGVSGITLERVESLAHAVRAALLARPSIRAVP